MNESGDNVIKRKKLNIFQRFTNRISRYFHKSKTSNLNLSEERNSSKSYLEAIPVSAKSHDDLRMKSKFQKKRKHFNNFLNCSRLRQRKKRKQCLQKRKNRCLSEGDLTQEEDQFYSLESSPKLSPKLYESNTNQSATTTSNLENEFNRSLRRSFKNELALKLRAKNSLKDNTSEHSKTPESPTGIRSGTSGTSHRFTEARTPQSMSSLSHSSNSLLSGNAANNYNTSDGDSMSRSVIDSNDDSGIVVDLTTPISKTTTATMLDFSAARQKIAASKPRRARPKALIKETDVKISSNEVERFSPVRDKRDILEEISEEDCPSSPMSVEIPKQHKPSDNSKTKRLSTKLVIEDNVPLTHKIVSIQLDSSQNDDAVLDQPIAEEKDTAKTVYSLRKSKFHFDSDRVVPERSDTTPKFYVKLRPTGSVHVVSSVDRGKDQRTTENVCLSDGSVRFMPPTTTTTEEECIPGPAKINRYSSLRSFPVVTEVTKDITNVPSSNVEKRASRVLNMVKNFETVPCSDSH